MTISIYDYDQHVIELFNQAIDVLQKTLPETEIHHVGSTSIPGLGGKGIIDILIAIPDWVRKAEAGEKLVKLGFSHVHKEINNRIFMSRIGETVKNDVHLHLTFIGSSEYVNILAFRDYLRAHPDEAAKYLRLKHEWLKDAKGNRKLYAAAKNAYISHILELAL
ncbi:MAG: GrpB family protein [bacterium]